MPAVENSDVDRLLKYLGIDGNYYQERAAAGSTPPPVLAPVASRVGGRDPAAIGTVRPLLAATDSAARRAAPATPAQAAPFAPAPMPAATVVPLSAAKPVSASVKPSQQPDAPQRDAPPPDALPLQQVFGHLSEPSAPPAAPVLSRLRLVERSPVEPPTPETTLETLSDLFRRLEEPGSRQHPAPPKY